MLGWFEIMVVMWMSCLWIKERCTLLLFRMEYSQKVYRTLQEERHSVYSLLFDREHLEG